jgi:hypothetical protein
VEFQTTKYNAETHRLDEIIFDLVILAIAIKFTIDHGAATFAEWF